MIGGVTTLEIIWTGGVSHLNGLPHLPGVTHLHVNRPLFNSHGLVHTHGFTGSLRVFTGENVVVTELKLSNVRSFIIFRSGKNLTSFNKNKVNILLAAVLDLVWPWNVNARTKQKQQRHGNERFDWFIERIQTRVAFGWLSERAGEKTPCQRTRYFTLTSYCNTIGQSNNAFNILGFSLAGKRRVHVLRFSSIGW